MNTYHFYQLAISGIHCGDFLTKEAAEKGMAYHLTRYPEGKAVIALGFIEPVIYRLEVNGKYKNDYFDLESAEESAQFYREKYQTSDVVVTPVKTYTDNIFPGREERSFGAYQPGDIVGIWLEDSCHTYRVRPDGCLIEYDLEKELESTPHAEKQHALYKKAISSGVEYLTLKVVWDSRFRQYMEIP